MSGSECYDSLKTGFKECWDEINQVIDDGQLEISPGHNIPIEVFLGGDYKVQPLSEYSLLFSKTTFQRI